VPVKPGAARGSLSKRLKTEINRILPAATSYFQSAGPLPPQSSAEIFQEKKVLLLKNKAVQTVFYRQDQELFSVAGRKSFIKIPFPTFV
jgi:hypothetical protein